MEHEITLEDLFNWLQAENASEAEESQKLELIDDLLCNDDLIDERAGLWTIKADMLSESAWPSATKIMDALGAYEHAVSLSEKLAKAPIAIDRLIKLGHAFGALRTEHNAETLDQSLAHTAAALELIADPEGQWREYVPEDQAQRLAASTKNAHAAALYETTIRGDRSDLTAAERLLREALDDLGAEPDPALRLQILNNLMFVAASADDWKEAKRWSADFDKRAAEIAANTTPSGKAEFELDIAKARSLQVVIAAKVRSASDAFRRLEAIKRGEIGDQNRRPESGEPFGFPAGALYLSIHVPPQDMPALAFLCSRGQDCELRIELIELPDLNRANLLAVLAKGEDAWLPRYAGLGDHQRDAFRKTIDGTLVDLRDRMEPLFRQLDKIAEIPDRRLFLSLTNILGYLPVHAIPLGDGTALCERVEVTHVRCLDDIEDRSARPATNPRKGNLLALADPIGNLPYAEGEAAAIAKGFAKCTILSKKEVTRDALLQHLRPGNAYTHVHFAGHARHHWSELSQPGLVLTDGSSLSLEEIGEHCTLNPGTIVVLSACESGIPDVWKLPHAHHSLVDTFLEVGASAVISTLWPVDDEATSILMQALYSSLAKGVNAASALREAQSTLQDSALRSDQAPSSPVRYGGTDPKERPDSSGENRFAHPYYWAGFTCYRRGNENA